MSQFQERLDQQDLPGRISRAHQVVESIPDELRAQIDASYPEYLNRFRNVLDYSLTVVGPANGELLSDQTLNTTVQQLDQFVAYAEAMIEQSTITQVPQMEVAINGLLSSLASWPTIAGPKKQEVAQTVGAFRRSLEAEATKIQSALEDVSNQVTSLEQKLTEAAPELNAQVAAAQQTLTQQVEQLDTRLTDVKTSIESEKARVDQLAAQQQQQFSDAQDQRTKEHDSTVAAWREAFGTLERETKTTFGEVLETIEAHQTRAEELVGYIAATGTASAYGKEANQQAGVANWLRYAAIGVGAVASIFAIWAVRHGLADNQNVASGIAKTLTALALYGIAGYLASQSGRHRRREEIAKSRELDLLAFDSFVAPLDETERQKVRSALADRIFGRDWGSAEGEPAITQDNITLVSRLFDLFNKSRH